MEITVTYNDLVVDQFFIEGKLSSFIHKNSKDDNNNNSLSSGEMIFEMLIKSCDVLKMHYDLLLMSNIYQNNEGDKKLTKKQLRHKIRIENFLKNYYDSNVNTRFPPNGGLLVEKVVTIIEETMNMFCLGDNCYKKQLSYINSDDLKDYLLFKKQIKKQTFGNFYSIYNMNDRDRSNKLYLIINLIKLENVYQKKKLII